MSSKRSNHNAEKTFAQACEAWEASMRNVGRMRETTLRSSVSSLTHLRRRLGSRPLAEISRAELEETLATIRRERKLSGTSMLNTHITAKRVFAFAVDRGWLAENPMAKIPAPRKNAVIDRRSLTVEECARLRLALDRAEDAAFADLLAAVAAGCWPPEGEERRMSKLVTASCIMAVRIELASGLRRSEALGLTWGSVNLERGVLCVRQSIAELADREAPGHPVIEVNPTKTHAGTRQLCVDEVCVAHLMRWQQVQARVLRSMHAQGVAAEQCADTPVCIGDAGTWLSPQRVSYWWGTPRSSGFRDVAGLPGVRMHELRHTQATLLLSAGVDIKTVQTRLGHSTSNITLDMYAHALPANDRHAADAIGAIAAGASSGSAAGQASLGCAAAIGVTEEQAQQARSRLQVV